ncbi:hypothetical protein GCM10022245_59720 [Streptomyces mayteni]
MISAIAAGVPAGGNVASLGPRCIAGPVPSLVRSPGSLPFIPIAPHETVLYETALHEIEPHEIERCPVTDSRRRPTVRDRSQRTCTPSWTKPKPNCWHKPPR